jgi:hypothetical protein
MNLCKNCSNNEICGNKHKHECEHYDISFTRSEVMAMLKGADEKKKVSILNAVEHVYKIKLAF